MKQLYLIVFVVFSISCFSQEAKIDSLSTLIDNANNPTERAKLLLKRSKAYPAIKTAEPKIDAVRALNFAKEANDYKLQIEAFNQISSVSFRENNYEEALVNDNQALALSITHNDALGKVTSYKNIGRNLKSLGKIDEAIAKTVLAKQIAVDQNLTQEYATVNNALGILYRVNGQFEKSLEVLDEALNQTKNKKLLALIQMNKGNTLSELMRLDEAADSYFAGLKINDALQDEKGKLQSYNNLSVLFKKTKQYDKAIAYGKKSLEISKKNDLKSSIAITYDNLANIYDLTNKKDSIVWYRKQAITLFEGLKDEKNAARCYHNLGHYYLLHDNYAEAKKYLTTALQKRLKIKNPIDIASTQTSLGILADKEKNYLEAEDYLLKAKELVKNEKTENKAFLLNALSDHYKMKGDLEKALSEKQAAMQLKDSLLQNDEVVKVLTKNHDYQIDKKNIEIQNAESFKTKYNINRLVFGALLFIVFLIALYSFIRWKKLDFNKKQLLIEKNRIKEKHESTLVELETVKKKAIIEHIILKNKSKIILDELLYIHSDDHYLEFITKGKKEITRGSLKQFEDQLPSNFLRCHKSYIINTNYIKSNNVKEIIMQNNDVIPTSRNYKRNEG
jgi:tetratricopeptide (TPR) repeat protein